MRNCIASTETLRWVDELLYMTRKKNKEQNRSGFITQHLIKAALPEMISGCMNKPVKLHMADVHKIYQIAEMLENSTHTVTAKELSAQYNISSYKLEKGFKEVYGHSVLHHRYEEKMRLALRLVNNTEYNSKQVAAMLGYSEPQSFSRAFRKRFGYAPYRNAPKYAI
jgi:AraC-like DNA-binding protein